MKQWDWDNVFKILVKKCDEQGDEAKLTPKEVAHLKKTKIGKGWGKYNIHLSKIFDIYREKYQNYDFGMSGDTDRKYIWCRKKMKG